MLFIRQFWCVISRAVKDASKQGRTRGEMNEGEGRKGRKGEGWGGWGLMEKVEEIELLLKGY